MSYIYFAQMNGTAMIKIGRAADPVARVASFKTANPRTPVLLGSIRETDFLSEADIHRRFDRCRVNGEWFALFPELQEFLEELSIQYYWSPEIKDRFLVDFVSSLSEERLLRLVHNAESMLNDLNAGLEEVACPSPS